ncbi:DNA polymerase/3'-5' exonuclease PolX [Trinickia sp. NRRL B-1857]|uniref:DNA polymerase/3'-5' exonuclease PolX n=1 Tax=Trinickia sp. NRRL B-1857 TaxID=3162879 RepID=UPI003D2C39E5
MPLHNAEMASVFEQIADLLEIQGANPFRVRAYRNAARSVGEFGKSVPAMIEQNEDVKRIAGIGDDLAAKLREIAATGTCELLTRLRAEMPAAITELLQVQGLGPKRVRALYDALHVQTIEQLREAAEQGLIRTVPGFGEKTQAHILERLEAHAHKSRRFALAFAERDALPLLAHLRTGKGVEQAVVAGSFRRRCETVGDLDILATARDGRAVIEHFVRYGEVRQVLARGDTRSSVVLASGMQVDLRVVEPESFGAALVYFTGSKAHNIAMRRIAQGLRLKINEYGVFRGEDRIAGRTEESVYAAIGLDWVPPELRERHGEIEAAHAHTLPCLIERADLVGDLHAHTRASDGRASLLEMALAARERGLQYLAVTDHSSGADGTRGLDAAHLGRQIDEIDALNRTLHGVVLLKGIEVDILEDGRLGLPDAILERLDIVVGAVHTGFDLPRARQTERVLRALEHPSMSILAHPTGRLIGEREPCDIDLVRVMRRARALGCHLELDAQPNRLDLTDTYCRMAKAEGVLVAIDSDAHDSAGFDDLRYGVDQARRGWLETKDVLNTRGLDALRPLLRASASRLERTS